MSSWISTWHHEHVSCSLRINQDYVNREKRRETPYAQIGPVCSTLVFAKNDELHAEGKTINRTQEHLGPAGLRRPELQSAPHASITQRAFQSSRAQLSFVQTIHQAMATPKWKELYKYAACDVRARAHLPVAMTTLIAHPARRRLAQTQRTRSWFSSRHTYVLHGVDDVTVQLAYFF